MVTAVKYGIIGHMSEKESYKIITKEGCGEIVEKKSRFIANVFAVENQQEAEEKISAFLTKHDSIHDRFIGILALPRRVDPANFNFNGFNIISERNGEEEIMFYSHVATDEAGLNEIFNHSKFNLVLDSMFFNPYICHLPNMAANGIYPDEDKDYNRNLTFSVDDRNNLIVSMIFTVTSSWYNEAVMLARDVELGSFYVQIPIEEDALEDGMFIYRRSTIDANREYYEENKELFDPESPEYDSTLIMPDTTYLSIYGDCFIVPRSYMPLPGGIAHWGTGEYNVEMYLMEQCNITSELREHWRRDYRRLNRMKKESRFGNYLVSLCRQNGNSIMRMVLETTADSALEELNFY